MATRRRILLLSAFLFLGISQCSPPDKEPALAALSPDLEPLRAEFNKDAGRVRLLLLLDPT